jgi:hypothetical protein
MLRIRTLKAMLTIARVLVGFFVLAVENVVDQCAARGGFCVD